MPFLQKISPFSEAGNYLYVKFSYKTLLSSFLLLAKENKMDIKKIVSRGSSVNILSFDAAFWFVKNEFTACNVSHEFFSSALKSCKG